MFLLIVIVILLVATGILGNVYLGIFSFQQNYGDLENYNNSYYAAISSLERGLLVTKYKEPSFVGSGGFLGTGNWGELSEMFSGNFGKYNENNNGLDRNINSSCSNITGQLSNKKALIIPSSLFYSGTDNHYEYGELEASVSFTRSLWLTGTITSPKAQITTGNIFWQLTRLGMDGYDDRIIYSSGDTLIDYNTVKNNGEVTYNPNIIDPSQIEPIGNTLCNNLGCVTGQTIHEIYASHDTELTLYINEDFIDNNGRVGYLNYDFELNSPTSCPYYYIDGNGTIGKYQQNLSIQKPTYNYKNPNRESFIFPYYE